jgi:hypothetical protein
MSDVLRANVSSVTQLRWRAMDQDLISVRVGCHYFVQQEQYAYGGFRCGITSARCGDFKWGTDGGGEGGNWHSRNEWYRPADAYYGPQNALLTIVMLTGLEGVSKPALQVRLVK